MVEIDKGPGDRGRKKGELGVGDIEPERVAFRLAEAVRECSGSKHKMNLPEYVVPAGPIMIYGSFARGTAVRNESDIDTIVPITKRGNSDPSSIVSNLFESCVGGKEKLVSQALPSYVNGFDVTVVSNKMKWMMALRFALGEGRGSEEVVYNAEKGEKVHKRGIVKMIATQIRIGEVTEEDIDIQELEDSPLDRDLVDSLENELRKV